MGFHRHFLAERGKFGESWELDITELSIPLI
jgi:hypothetical protein